MSDPSILLEAKNVTRAFPTENGPLEILKGADLTMARGEMAALLGVSGSGKSTLMQILGTLDKPTSGEVILSGVSLFKQSDRKQAEIRNRRIGFVYQFHHLLPEFTALENVAMPLLIQRIRAADAQERAGAILKEVGLSERLRHKPGQLSGGERQRVAIARAIVTGPDLLLADEPTGNLDVETAQSVHDLLLDLNEKRGLTCLMVTHNPELAKTMGRILRLEEGRVVEDNAG